MDNKAILLHGVVGSTAHGLAREGSDEDTLGVFAVSTLDIAGLNWHSGDESLVTHEPDLTLHEAGKFLRLVLKGNPTVLELLFLDKYYTITPLGQDLIDMRQALIDPRRIKTAYLGYAKSQIDKFERNARNGKDERKTARHTLRLVEQGANLLIHGGFSIRVANPQRYFDLDEMEFEEVLKILLQGYETLKALPEDSAPDHFDRSAAIEWLRRVRLHYLSDSPN